MEKAGEDEEGRERKMCPEERREQVENRAEVPGADRIRYIFNLKFFFSFGENEQSRESERRRGERRTK